MVEREEMSRKGFSVAYAGSDREHEHSFEVETLAPALFAFGKLIREANREVNGKHAKAQVLVVSDFDHKCFNINFEVVFTFYEQIKSLIGVQDVKDAKEILEWLDILKGVVIGGGSTLGFLGYLRWRRGRKVENATTMTDTDQAGMVKVTVEGDKNSVNITNHTWNMSRNPRALTAARDAFAPLGREGFDRVEFRDGDDLVGELSKEETDDILTSCVVGLEEASNMEPDIEETSAWLTVHSPVYDKSADKWQFKMGREIINADISQTSIAVDAIDQRGGALADDAYQVRLEIETPRTPDGKAKKPIYRVLEVLRFVPAQRTVQPSLFEEPENDDDAERGPEEGQT